MSDHSPHEPPPFDTTTPHSARAMNYWLGGKDWYPADRAMGEQVMDAFPEIVTSARACRAFLIRTVTHLARDAGLRQFLDLGTGLPTANNTHEIAQAAAPESKVVYVDNDPMVLAHARALLTSAPEGVTDYIDADIRDTGRVLEGAAQILDFTRPIAVTTMGVLLHLSDEEAYAAVDQYVDALPPGSYLAVCDNTNTSPGIIEAARRWNESVPVKVNLRSPEGIAQFFHGLELQEPGVVPATEWRPDPIDIGTHQQDVDLYGGVARKR